MEMREMAQTTDLFLAAYLFAEGITYQGTRRLAGGRVAFCFSEDDETTRLISAYHAGQAICLVLSLKEALHHLKDELFAVVRKERRRDEDHERTDRSGQATLPTGRYH
jgi:hypothetical protein